MAKTPLKIKDLQGELANRNTEYQMLLGQLSREVEGLNMARPSTHHGHNLGNRCAALSALAGKIEMLENVIRWATDDLSDEAYEKGNA